MTKKQVIEQPASSAAAEGTPPVVWVLCRHCFGTGTIFVGTALRIGNSRVCPVCRGKTKVPA